MGQTTSECPEAEPSVVGRLSAIVDGKLLLWGGHKRTTDVYFPHEDIYSWNLLTRSWSKKTVKGQPSEDLPRPSTGSRIAVIANSQIYQFGGRYGKYRAYEYLRDLHKLDWPNLTWEKISPRTAGPDGREECGLCVLGDRLAMIGGASGSYHFDDFWLFSPHNRSWHPVLCKGKRPSRRRGHSFTAIDEDHAILFGGRNEEKVFGDLFLVSLDIEEWTEILLDVKPGRVSCRSDHSAAFANIPEKGLRHLFVLWGINRYQNAAEKGLIINLITKEEKKVSMSGITSSYHPTTCFALQNSCKWQILRVREETLPFPFLLTRIKVEELEWDLTSMKSSVPVPIKDPTPVTNDTDSCSRRDATVEIERELEDYHIARNEFDYDKEEDDDFIKGGGFGEVYKATMKRNRDTVALKVFFKTRRTQKESNLLYKEAKVLFGIKPHPHIIAFIGFCNSPDCCGLLMEYISGGSLQELLESSCPEVEKWENRIDISCQIAMGMAHLHANSPPVIHLDLKSANVLIEKTENDKPKRPFVCKICDFGLAKMTGVSSITQERNEGSIPAGTVAYISPERYEVETYGSGSKEEKMEIAKKSDVFSYGVLLWKIRERKCPFEGMDSKVIQHKIRSGETLPLGNGNAPESYNNLLINCAAFRPADRPSFSDIVECLQKTQA
eukprot:m.213175 g.213175  ORF g.213175 m.213175 type:complete len:667 (+) comp39784_c0_seq19:145-2145(+)